MESLDSLVLQKQKTWILKHFKRRACRAQISMIVAVREVLFNGREAFAWAFFLNI